MSDAPYLNHADLGGVPGCGAVNPEVDEPLFHAAWERRVLALTLAMGGTGAMEHRPLAQRPRNAAGLPSFELLRDVVGRT